MDSNTFSLHKYFIWCNSMRCHFDNVLQNKHIYKKADYQLMSIMYMSYWYASLYVVIEGYQELHLHDEIIDNLLDSENVSLLKRYRNGVYHFQKDYYDSRFGDFIISADNPVDWVRTLNSEFGRFFLNKFKGA